MFLSSFFSLTFLALLLLSSLSILFIHNTHIKPLLLNPTDQTNVLPREKIFNHRRSLSQSQSPNQNQSQNLSRSQNPNQNLSRSLSPSLLKQNLGPPPGSLRCAGARLLPWMATKSMTPRHATKPMLWMWNGLSKILEKTWASSM